MTAAFFENPASTLPRGGFPTSLALLISLVLHAGLIAGLLTSALFRPPLIADQETIHVKLARLGTPRDPKLLPRKPEEAPAQPDKPVPLQSKPILEKIETPPPKHTAEKTTANRDRLRDSLSKLEKQVDRTGQVDGFQTGTDDVTEGDLYWARVVDRVRRFYVVPNTIAEAERQKLVAALKITIAADGTILEVRSETASGNATFDRALLDAVRKMRTLPQVPPHLQKQAREGVVLEFRAAQM
jgi:colicin import membrane protein